MQGSRELLPSTQEPGTKKASLLTRAPSGKRGNSRATCHGSRRCGQSRRAVHTVRVERSAGREKRPVERRENRRKLARAAARTPKPGERVERRMLLKMQRGEVCSREPLPPSGVLERASPSGGSVQPDRRTRAHGREGREARWNVTDQTERTATFAPRGRNYPQGNRRRNSISPHDASSQRPRESGTTRRDLQTP